MSEAFNNTIINVRSKPIISMMKELNEDAFKHLIAIPPRQVIHTFLIEQY